MLEKISGLIILFFIVSHTSFSYGKVPTVIICTQNQNINKLQKQEFIPIRYSDQIDESTFSKLCSQDSSYLNARLRKKGNSSFKFKKAQIRIKFEKADGSKLRRSTLGLAVSDSLTLHGPYIDRSYMRNALMYDLGRKLGDSAGRKWWAPKSQYVKVVLDNEFLGLYLAVESVERSAEKLSLKKSVKQDPSFIMEVSSPDQDFKTSYGSPLKYKYPKEKNLSPELKGSLIKTIESFEKVVFRKGVSFEELSESIDVLSFVDYFIFREFSKDIDAYRRSAFFHKDAGGKVVMGPLWDFNGTLGNMNVFSFGSKKRLIKDSCDPSRLCYKEVSWFKKLIKNKNIRILIRQRFRSLRKEGEVLSASYLKGRISHFKREIREEAIMDSIKWKKTLSCTQKMFQNTREKSKTFDGNVRILEEWALERLSWMDKHFASSKWLK